MPGSAQLRSEALALELEEQTGSKVHTDMHMWTEIRRKVLVEGRRSARSFGTKGSATRCWPRSSAIPSPPNHQVGGPHQKPKLGEFLGAIDAADAALGANALPSHRCWSPTVPLLVSSFLRSRIHGAATCMQPADPNGHRR